MTGPVRVGGVPEHFNLPWHLAIEDGRFDDLDVPVEWIEFPGGTGAIMGALADGTVDLATPLTEGAITSIASGNPSRLVAVWVDSPLRWGVHVAGDSEFGSIGELAGARFAISRFGSGSELMSRVLAEEEGWQLADEQWVVVGDLAGALEALPAGDADVFLWNKSMTQPHVDDGRFRRIGVIPTPWPSFGLAAATRFLERSPELARSLLDIALERAARLVADPGAVELVAERYGLDEADAADWLDHVRYPAPGTPIDPAMVGAVAERMRALGRIESIVEPATIIDQPNIIE